MSPKERYRKLCAHEESIPLFSRDWWLDTVAGNDNWDVTIVTNGERIDAALPFVELRRRFCTTLSQPPLSQTLGPWIRPASSKYAKKLSREKTLLLKLFDTLPPHQRYSQNWHHSQQNWLPLHWRKFKQTTLYTYRLANIDDAEELWAGLQENIRTDIRKAKDRFKLTVKSNASIHDFLPLHNMTFERQGMQSPYSDAFLHNVDAACCLKNARKIFIAEDPDGKHHAGIYIVWDGNSAYYLLSGGDPKLRNSGATSLCLWEAIQHSSHLTTSFDFEGSMIEPIEKFFRGFGAIQTPYNSISRINPTWLRIALAFKNSTQNL